MPLDHLAEVIISGWGVGGACAAIVGFALITAFCYFRRTRPFISELGASIARIRELADPTDFAVNFKKFSDWMSDQPMMGHFWSEFNETLVQIPPPQQPVVANSDEAACCFNEANLLTQHLNLRFFAAIPNYLTGFGITGTFIGLVAGIYLASKGLSSGDAKQLQTALMNLLDGASLAFFTSICGLTCSIAFSIVEKRRTHRIRHLLTSWNEALDKRVKRLTTVSLGHDQLLELKQHTEHLETFISQVAYNISDRINQGMNDNLLPVLERLVKATEEMREDRGQTNEQLLRDMVDSFRETMTGAAGQEMRALGDSLSSMNEDLIPLLSDIKTANERMSGVASSISHGIERSYELGAQRFNDSMDSSMDKLRDAISQAGQSLKGDLKEASDSTIERLNGTLMAIDETVRGFQDAGQFNVKAVEGAREAVMGFQGVVGELNNLLESATQSVNTIQTATRNVESASTEARNTLTSIQGHLRQPS